MQQGELHYNTVISHQTNLDNARAHLLTRKFKSTLTVANMRCETLLPATRVDPLPASRPYRPPPDRFYILWS